jgi:hypothetical protein
MSLTLTSVIARAATLALGLACGAPATAQRAVDLFDFDSASGYAPWAGAIANAKGVLFGSTTIGGTGSCSGGAGCGTIWSFTPPGPGGGDWQLDVLFDFPGGRDGESPHAPLTLGPHGELYGYSGGGSPGTVFRLDPPSGARTTWRYNVLYTFAGGADGDLLYVQAPLVAHAGVLYGVASGGADHCGVNWQCGSVFRLKRAADGTWIKDTLWEFKGGGRGQGRPTSIVAAGDPAPLVVSTWWHGGSLVALSPQGGNDAPPWQAQVVATFHGDPAGRRPTDLVAAPDGNVYGVAYSKHGLGRVFQLMPPGANGGKWTHSVIASVAIHDNGPGSLAAGPDGTLIGTVFGDFDFFPGAVFRLVPPADNGGWTVDWLWRFRNGPDRNPIDIVSTPAGHLLGVLNGGDSTSGSIFELRVN